MEQITSLKWVTAALVCIHTWIKWIGSRDTLLVSSPESPHLFPLSSSMAILASSCPTEYSGKHLRIHNVPQRTGGWDFTRETLVFEGTRGVNGWHNGLKCVYSEIAHLVRAKPLNCMKAKPADDRAPARNAKKPKKAGANYRPPDPRGKTDETLEKEPTEPLYEVKKKGQQSNRQRENAKHVLILQHRYYSPASSSKLSTFGEVVCAFLQFIHPR